MTKAEEARAEAFKRYDGDTILDENTGERVSHDDWGYAETARQAFIAGAEWARPAAPTDADREGLIVAIGYDPVPLSIRDHPEITFEYRTITDRDGLIERILAAGYRKVAAE
ncbi:hypothetical protein [Microbacterium sp. zg-YB36]|uniref:hypothetical protein n=1 Tax=Microbacterium sp. zg-YB36 TaxID=2969407 RepID=UPI00214BA1A1|nr:hypothetical protein [Microbacterium sp. zg-YB36]MDL5351167.1 hypothetical protein [Microbacterium sp. zg-YB36]